MDKKDAGKYTVFPNVTLMNCYSARDFSKPWWTKDAGKYTVFAN